MAEEEKEIEDVKVELDLSGGESFIDKIVNFKGRILYGVPQDTAARAEDKDGKAVANNAQLLAIHEHGSPIRNLPPRELLEPVAKKHQKEIEETFNSVFNALIEGDEAGADTLMRTLALKLETWCKAYFRQDNGWEPDKPETIRAKNKRAGKPPNAPTTTLIDTGELRKSIRGVYLKD